MFARAFYAARYFAARFFPGVGGAAVETPADPAAGGEWVAHPPAAEWVPPAAPAECAPTPDPAEWVLSAMSATTPPVLTKKAAASRTYRVNFAQWPELRAGQVLTGTPAVSASPSGPTISGVAVDTANTKKVKFRVAGGTAGVAYTLTVTVSTDGGDTLAADVVLNVT